MKDSNLLRQKEAQAVLNIGRTKFFELVNKGILPKPIKYPHTRTSYWLESEILAIKDAAISNRGAAA